MKILIYLILYTFCFPILIINKIATISLINVINQISAPAITAFIAAIASLFAAASAFYQAHQLRFSLKIETLIKLEEKFNSKEFKKKRKAAATSIEQEPTGGLDDVLDFFDTIGLLVRRKALDKEMVWHTFYYWIFSYWNANKSYIESEQEKNSLVWQDFEFLYHEVLQIEKEKGRPSDFKTELSEDNLKEFINYEVF